VPSNSIKTCGLWALLSTLPLVSNGAAAQAVVIYDQGPTRPISDYVEPMPALAAPPPRPARNLSVPAPAYPVRTAGMSPGPVEARKAQLPQLAAAPFFLVGNDPLSRDWLARYGGKLAKMGAVGFLVQAESDADLMAMRQLASGVPITPLDATSLAKTLRLSHYPVLVSAGLIEQ
jgi:integrating conjugative element protein (TIGR03765 family)